MDYTSDNRSPDLHNATVNRLWHSDSWRVVLAEFLGTLLLLLFGCMGISCQEQPSPLHSALSFGLIVVAILQCFDHISGAQVNPTVTLAAVMYGKIPAMLGAAMVVAQICGAVLGFGFLKYAFLADNRLDANFCVTQVSSHISSIQAVVAEAVLSGALVLVNCGSWDARNRLLVDSWPIRIGLVVTGLSLAGGSLTGASMNPARSLGPAFWNGNWRDHWVYWLGPLSGSLLASYTYVSVWRPHPSIAPRAQQSGFHHNPIQNVERICCEDAESQTPHKLVCYPALQ